MPWMVDTAEGPDEEGGDHVRLRTQLRRVHTETTNLSARRVARRRPGVFGAFVIIKVDAFEADLERDVKLAQFDEITLLSRRNGLFAPGKERELSSVR